VLVFERSPSPQGGAPAIIPCGSAGDCRLGLRQALIRERGSVAGLVGLGWQILLRTAGELCLHDE